MGHGFVCGDGGCIGKVLLHAFSVVCSLAVPSTGRFVAAVVRRVSFLARVRVAFVGLFVF